MPTINNDETLAVRGALDLSRPTSVNIKDGLFPRAAIAENSLADYTLRLDDWRTWDNLAALLPGTAASDDLAIIEGTFGTDAPTIQTSDAKNTTVTQRMRRLVTLPADYRAGQDVQLVFRAGMITTVANGTATLDVEAYPHDDDGAVGADLCATSAQTINNLTKADKTFTITASTLQPGDTLDVRVTIAITDSATGTAVIGEISKVSLNVDAL